MSEQTVHGAGPEPTKARLQQRRLPVDAGACRLVQLLGEGGDGQVLRAEYPRPDGLPAPVAWTRLDAEPARARGGAGSWLKAWEGLSDLRHPGLLPVHGGGVFEGLPVLVTDLADGPTLLDVLGAIGPLGWRQAFELVVPIASALQFVHGASAGQPRRSLVHGDLRPGRIVVRADGQVRIGGLGLQGIAVPLAGRATVRIDDPRSCQPAETLAGQAADARADVFAVGALVAWAVLGRPPWEGGVVSGEARAQAVVEFLAAGGPLDAVGRPSKGVEVLKGLLAPADRRVPTMGDAWAQVRAGFASFPEEAPVAERLRDGLVKLLAVGAQSGGAMGPDPESTMASRGTGRFGARRSGPGAPVPLRPQPDEKVVAEPAPTALGTATPAGMAAVSAPVLPNVAHAPAEESGWDSVGPTRRMAPDPAALQSREPEQGLQAGAQVPTTVMNAGRPLHRPAAGSGDRAPPAEQVGRGEPAPAVMQRPPAAPTPSPSSPFVVAIPSAGVGQAAASPQGIAPAASEMASTQAFNSPPRAAIQQAIAGAAPQVRAGAASQRSSPGAGASGSGGSAVGQARASAGPVPQASPSPSAAPGPSAGARPAVGPGGAAAPQPGWLLGGPPSTTLPPARPRQDDEDDEAEEERQPRGGGIPLPLVVALLGLAAALVWMLLAPSAMVDDHSLSLEPEPAEGGGGAESKARPPEQSPTPAPAASAAPTPAPIAPIAGTAPPEPIAGTAPERGGPERRSTEATPSSTAPISASAPSSSSGSSASVSAPRPSSTATTSRSSPGPLVIHHVPLKKGRAGASDLLGARVDGGGTIEVIVHSGPAGGPFRPQALKAKQGGRFEGWLRFDVPAGTELHYWLEARRGSEVITEGSKSAPLVVPVP